MVVIQDAMFLCQLVEICVKVSDFQMEQVQTPTSHLKKVKRFTDIDLCTFHPHSSKYPLFYSLPSLPFPLYTFFTQTTDDMDHKRKRLKVTKR